MTQQSAQGNYAWQEILRLSEAMIAAAQAEEWDNLPATAQYRDSLIRSYFAPPVTVEKAIQMREEIAQMLALDEVLLGLARKEKSNTMAALKYIQKGSKAIRAYHA